MDATDQTMPSWITICDTCKRPGWETGPMTRTDGEALADLIEEAAGQEPLVRTRRVSCTMGCERACNVIVQGPGKIGYSLGRFEPEADAATAIVAYAAAHAATETGKVPFRTWPAGVKGHFVSRQLPLPDRPDTPDARSGPDPQRGPTGPDTTP